MDWTEVEEVSGYKSQNAPLSCWIQSTDWSRLQSGRLQVWSPSRRDESGSWTQSEGSWTQFEESSSSCALWMINVSLQAEFTQRTLVRSAEQLRTRPSLKHSRAAVTVSLWARNTFTGTCRHVNAPRVHHHLHMLTHATKIIRIYWLIYFNTHNTSIQFYNENQNQK